MDKAHEMMVALHAHCRKNDISLMVTMRDAEHNANCLVTKNESYEEIKDLFLALFRNFKLTSPALEALSDVVGQKIVDGKS